MNPYNIGYVGWVVFVCGIIVSIACGVVAGISAFYRSREKRDGKR